MRRGHARFAQRQEAIMTGRSVFTTLAIAAVSLAAVTVPAVTTPAAAQMVIGIGPEPAYYYGPPRGDRYDNRYRGRHGWGDRDRDGIPNRWDRYDNRYRYAYGWRDSDRDGVPDRWDRYDYNPWRR
jgi:hypothetical protein